MTFSSTHAPPRSLSGILFAEDFDDPFAPEHADQGAAPPDSASAEPVLTAADIEAAQQNGFAEGHRAATMEAAQGQAAAVQACLSEIATRLQEAGQQAETVSATASDAVARLLFGTLATLLPSLCARNDASEIAAIVAEVMHGMAGEPAVCVTVAPPLVEALRLALGGLAPHLARRVAIAGQDALAPGEARITWDGGSAGRSSRRAREAVVAVLTQLGLIDPPAPKPSPIPAWEPAEALDAASINASPDMTREVENARG